VNMMNIIVDSWAWIEYFAGTKYGAIVKEYLEKHVCFTPNIVLLEIAGKYAREGFSEKEILKRILFIIKKTEIIEFTYEDAVKASFCYLELREHARKLGLKKKPGIADGLLLALARRYNAKILTGDEHFREITEVIFIKAIKSNYNK